MKRLLPIIPIILLFLLNSCTGTLPLPIRAVGMEAAVAQTMTALSWTAVPTQTFNPNISSMVIWMNDDLASINPLESTLDAEYHVIDLSFPHLPESSNLKLQVDVSCMCMNNYECCIPERTFVMIVDSMKRNFQLTLQHVPPDVSEVMVICTDHKTKAKVGAVSAPWQDVKGYVQGNVSGYQLGALAKRVVDP